MVGPLDSGAAGSGSHAFDLFHPAVALAYCGVALVFAMCAMQPVYLLLTLTGQLVWRAQLVGVRRALGALAWQLPLVTLIAVANALFVASGSTELFRLGSRAFYLESLCYGACQGLMLAGVLVAFANAATVLSADKVMALLGNATPTVALMVSMTLRLVPSFVRRGAEIRSTARACTAARVEASGCVRESMRLATVLMGWGMEDSLEVADAMRSRGWGAASKRTTYQRTRFRATDAAALALVGALALSAALSATAACASFSFYPHVAGWAPWFSYAPYVAFLAVPIVAERGGRSW